MKYALITEDQIKAIEDALDELSYSSSTEMSQQKYVVATNIIQSLKPQEPVAWMCAFKFEATDENVEYVLDHAQDGKDYMMERLDSADNDEWRGEPTPLYSGEQP